MLRYDTRHIAGSSPRVRGKPGVRYDRLWTLRLIPACAGKTSQDGETWTSRPAHPRVCGENYDADRLFL